VYVDDGIFFGPSLKAIDKAMQDLTKAGYKLEMMGDVKDYLGINFETLHDGRIKMSQPQLIEQILKDVGLTDKSNVKSTPSRMSILQRDAKGSPTKAEFHYRSVVGKLNFLEKGTRPDIAYATHQCARFSEEPKQTHTDAVMWLCKYLLDTKDEGIIYDPQKLKSIEVYADADFCGNWNRVTAGQDVSTAKSRTGYLIKFAACPIVWISKLQSQIALSTTEAEYISLSQSLRDAIPLMQLIKEMNGLGITTYSEVPRVYCKAFEDNSGALEMAKVHKMRPRTKHLNLVFHHFRSFVKQGLVVIWPIGTTDQEADIFTKPTTRDLFLKLRKAICGW
jgi:hypothetical protein